MIEKEDAMKFYRMIDGYKEYLMTAGPIGMSWTSIHTEAMALPLDMIDLALKIQRRHNCVIEL